MKRNVLISAGVNDVGRIALHLEPGTYSIAGLITDIGTGKPVTGAIVMGEGRTVTTGPDGRYRLDGIANRDLTLSITASGYVSRTERVSLGQTGETVIDIALVQMGQSGLRIQSLKPSKASYHPSDTFTIEAILSNSSSLGAEAVVDALVFDPKGRLIMTLVANAHGQGQFPPNLPVSIPPGVPQL